MCSGTDRCVHWSWNKKNKKCHLVRVIPMDEMAGIVQSGYCQGNRLNSVIENKFSQKVVNGKISCGIYKSSISVGDSTTYIPCEDTTITGPYRGGNECAGYSGKSNNKYVIMSNGANGCEIVY